MPGGLAFYQFECKNPRYQIALLSTGAFSFVQSNKKSFYMNNRAFSTQQSSDWSVETSTLVDAAGIVVSAFKLSEPKPYDQVPTHRAPIP